MAKKAKLCFICEKKRTTHREKILKPGVNAFDDTNLKDSDFSEKPVCIDCAANLQEI